MRKVGLMALTLFVIAGSTYAQSKEAFVLCRNKKTVRTIRVEKSNQEFQTIYTKAGVDKTVGQASMYDSAINIMKNIRKNLEGAGWACADVEHFEVKRSTASQ